VTEGNAVLRAARRRGDHLGQKIERLVVAHDGSGLERILRELTEPQDTALRGMIGRLLE
jgi:hypothetical protein